MLSAQLRQEVSRPAGVPIDAARVRSLCRRHPVGAIVDNKMRARVWAALLLDGQAPPPLPDVKGAKMDPEDARVVDADVKRTRGYLPIFQEGTGTQELMRALLTTHCLASGMKYKQGLHELLAPFVALSPDPPAAPLAPELVYGLFQAFISRYMGPFFRDDGMAAVKEGFGLFNLLLQYHDPELAGHLAREGFPPELYAAPFFLTLFAHGLELYLVHRLWDTYISLDDPTLIYYLALGLLALRRDLLLRADSGELPEVVSHIKLRSPEDIAAVLHTALEAREQTPLSFTRDLHRAATTPSIPSEEETPEGEKDVDWEDEGWEARKGLAPLNFHAAHTGTMGAPAGRMMGQQQQDVIEVGPAELVRSWLAGEEAKQQREEEQDEEEEEEAAAGAMGKMSLGRPGRTDAEATTSRPASPSSPSKQPATTTEQSDEVAGALPPPIRYLILDARSHEEHHSSGAGVLRGALRLDPQVALRSPEALEAWLRLHDLFPAPQSQRQEREGGDHEAVMKPPVHLCVVGSRIRRRRQGEEPDSLWRRLLLGEGDEAVDDAPSEEEGEGAKEGIERAAVGLYADTGDALVRALRARGHAHVSKLRGGFNALIDFLALCHGPASVGLGQNGAAASVGFWVNGRLFPPVVERHDAMAWERWRRKHFRLSKLPPAFYTTTGLQRPMVLPSESEGAAHRHHQFERPDTVFPAKRLHPDAMAELAEAELVARQHGHAGAAAALQAAIQRQKRMIELGIGEDADDDDDGDNGGHDKLTLGTTRRPPLPIPTMPSLPTPVSLPSLRPLKSPLAASATGASVSGAGGKQLLGKAQQLLDKADSWVSGVVMRGRSVAGGGQGQGQGQGHAEGGAKEMLEELWMER